LVDEGGTKAVLKGYRVLRGPFFVADAEADGDVGVPGGGQGGCFALKSWAMPEDGPPKVDGKKNYYK
jgi:hypothetical protein